MKKGAKKKKHNYKNKIFLCIIVAILIVAAVLILSDISNNITGNTVSGVSISNPQKSSSGYTVSYDLKISKDVTKNLAIGSMTQDVAAALTDAVNQANGLAQDGLKSLLGLPSIPDIYGVLAGIASWLKDNSDPCLKKIGTTFNGKDFSGKYYYSVSKGKGSYIYPDWDYYYATATYTGPNNFKCQTSLGCVFSFKPSTKEISKSCFG
jgi:hypothetical protein